MSGSKSARTYLRTECAVFRKTGELFGGLSNMAPGYPIRVNGVRIFTVEALYQACRFPHLPNVQQLIIGQHSPMTAKMVSKPYREDSRPDWDRVRVKVMRWCLRMKLTQHWLKFSQLLLSTGDRSIVEDSRKDGFWGAIPTENNTLVGMNVLGRLLMELRESIKDGAELRRIEPPALSNFLLFGKPLQVVDFRTDKSAPVAVEAANAKELYDEGALPLFADDDSILRTAKSETVPLITKERSHGMIEGLQAYAEYKESGHRCLGQIPRGWSLLPLCRVATPKSECGRSDLELLSVYLHRGVIRYSESGGQVHKPSMDLSNYQVVEPGDFVLNNQQAWRGSIGVSKYQGIVSPAYVVMKLSPALNPDYANYLFRSPAMVAQYVVASRGVGDIQRNLYYPDLRDSTVAVPPPDEQAAIARFLDHANRKIDGFIRAKRKLIGLLNEQKQAIIETAISKVSAPDCRTMPVRAVLRPVKRMGHPNKTLLSLFRDYGVIPKDSRENKNVDVRDLATCQLVKPGDVVMNKMKAWQGSIAVSGLEGIVSPDYMVLEFQITPVVEDFFHYALRSPSMVANYRKQAYGVRPGQWRLMYPDFCRLKLPVPSVEAQQSIVDHISSETQGLNTAIARTEREIALMQEYRTRLTADIVTGKLDVREAAARLPDPTPGTSPDSEAIDEIEASEV